jgi:hypothetical protein
MKKRHTPEQIVRMLREADAELAAGASVPEIARKLGIRCFISWLRRSRPFVVRMRLLWLSGKAGQLRHSSRCSSR